MLEQNSVTKPMSSDTGKRGAFRPVRETSSLNTSVG
ncbi:MAG: hypothetical protein JWP84_1820 [Tardiphaga sp.]|jgi:hypothetical protein|nr:hypothetical protein [Tardiphaga sp.]